MKLDIRHSMSYKAGFGPGEDKIDAVINWPRRETVKDERSFVGLAGYYRKYIKKYYLFARNLTDLNQLQKYAQTG